MYLYLVLCRLINARLSVCGITLLPPLVSLDLFLLVAQSAVGAISQKG